MLVQPMFSFVSKRSCSGEETATNGVLNSCEVYDVEMDQFTMLRPMNIARARCGVTVSRGNFCCTGGSDRHGKGLDSVEVFNIFPGTLSFGKKLYSGLAEVSFVTAY